jgi:photosynthetic reaction center cytochrome c subunit
MNTRWKAVAAVTAGFLFTFFVLMTAGRGPRSLAQENSSQPKSEPATHDRQKPPRGGMGMTESLQGKTAGQAFKNVQVLKDIPAEQLIPTMEFVAASLGVRCDFCHDMKHFESDDKQTKKTARKMMQMELAIDKDNFNGEQLVTCDTCHNGSAKPRAIPAVAEHAVAMMPMPMHGEGAEVKPVPPPRPDAVLAKYIQAMGGAEALAKVKTRDVKGTISMFGHEVPVEVTEKAPDMRISVMRMGNRGESVTAFDGKAGWMSGGPRPPHQMMGGELAAAQLDARLAFPTELKALFHVFRPRPPEKINDKETEVLAGLRPGQPPTEFYFDKTTALLLRVVSYEQTALGRLPEQIDFSDYRDVDGVKVPYAWTIARPQSRFTIRATSVEQNIPVKDSKFAMPAAANGQ